MKRILSLFCYTIVVVLLGFSCMPHDDTSIRYTETNDFYAMKAHFNESKTRDVEKYMDHRIGRKSHMSFVNSKINGTIALDDHTMFYIKKYPGMLEIKLDKDENSRHSYLEIKEMCLGIKKIIDQ